MEQLIVANLPFIAKQGQKTSDKFQLWNVPLKLLVLVPGLIPRIETRECLEHIDSLAGSMKKHGFFPDKPLVGYAGKDANQNSVVYITQGGMRYKAEMLAGKRETIPVMVCESAADAADMLVQMVTANTGRPFMFLELAVICKRLARMGWDNTTIAKKLRVGEEKVDLCQELTSADERVRQLVASGLISGTLAIEMIRKHGANAYDALESAKRRAEEAGAARTANA
jgi:ParB-like chromosome segregation protein Spo0J